MSPSQNALEQLKTADDGGEVALTRYLCEIILNEYPDHERTLIRYARCLIELALYEEAAAILERAESNFPKKLLHFVRAQQGHRLENLGDYHGAENRFLEAHRLDPDEASYLIFAACAAFRSGRITRAEKLARRAINCSEGCIDEAHFNLGGYLLAQKRYSEARECYQKALEIDTDYSIAKKRLADVEKVIKATRSS